ncbi:MAG TPA: hypothetical protein VIN03_08850 [Roseateles sp.]
MDWPRSIHHRLPLAFAAVLLAAPRGSVDLSQRTRARAASSTSAR